MKTIPALQAGCGGINKLTHTNRGITTTNITDTITTYSLRVLVEISGIEMDTGHMGIVK